MIEPQSAPPLVLVASEGEWLGRSLENVLESTGYAVLRVESGRRALELARRTNPDAIILDDSLADIPGVDVCRALRDDPLFDRATPIFISAAAQHASRVRAAAYAAGAWEYCTQPLDVETLLYKLGTFVAAKNHIETARSRALVDRLTGLYSQYGIEQWIEQLGARAVRKNEPIACVIVTRDMATNVASLLTDEQLSSALADFTDVCRSHSRKSDIVGYLGDSRVAILAPDTDVLGVERLIERLQDAMGQIPSRTRANGRLSSALLAGYCAVSNFATANVAPGELVRRAERALEAAGHNRTTSSVNFDHTLTS
jgi:diguanylate cyclase (GGDEF)-like protein